MTEVGGGRFDLRGRSLRVVAARGTIVNTIFLVGLTVLGFLRGFILARFISTTDYGVWGVLIVSLGTLLWLKQVGIGDKYIQQDDEDQELAFQRAFTLELIVTGGMSVLIAVAIPVVALVYGADEVVAPGLVLLLVLPALALQAPLWIFYRRMNFVRQRLLQSIEPVVGFAVSVVLAVAGAGYWALVVGIVAGSWTSALAAIRFSPYRLRLRLDRVTFREYLSFSWPLFLVSGAGILVAQASLLGVTRELGLAAAGAVTLAASISQFTDRVDQIVTGTLYPAICAVADDTRKLHESFVKSNRLALIWAVPFGVGLALFGDDLVRFALGEEWKPAVVLIQAFGLIAAANHLGFNWDAYYRARAETRPIGIAAITGAVVFLIVLFPLLHAYDLRGLAYALAVQTGAQLIVRAAYLRRLFAGFGLIRHAARAIAPSVPAVGAVLLLRATESGSRSGGEATLELLVYLVVTTVATLLIERRLLREAIGYVRGRPDVAADQA
jgi:O-antigen/teichoic acid export membrane protein